MSDDQQGKADPAQDTGTPTKHGLWTPEVSKAADRELRELARDTDQGPTAATESVDKSHLSVPDEPHPGED